MLVQNSGHAFRQLIVKSMSSTSCFAWRTRACHIITVWQLTRRSQNEILLFV